MDTQQVYFTKIIKPLAIGALILLFLFGIINPIRAAAGINKQISFQGKVVNSNGTNVSDGYYSFVFKLYNSAATGAGAIYTEDWTTSGLWTGTVSSRTDADTIVYATDTNESTLKEGQYLTNTTRNETVLIRSVDTGTNTLEVSDMRTTWAGSDAISNKIYVKDGVFRVNLGTLTSIASVDFNADAIYLGTNFNGDGEMRPLVKYTATPYAFNAQKVNGLTVTNTSDLPFSTTTTLKIGDGKTVSIADNFTTSGANPLTLTTTATTNVTLPTSGTLLTNTASAVQTITSTQASGTVLGVADSSGLSGGITGFNVALTSSTNSQNKTGISFDLSGGTGGTYYDILGSGSTWSITRAGVLTVSSCSGCGGGGSTLQQAYATGETISVTSGEGALAIDLASANLDITAGEGSDTGDFRLWDGSATWVFVDESADTLALGAAAGSGITLGGSGITTTNAGLLAITEGFNANGTTTLGDNATDTITFTGSLNSNFNFLDATTGSAYNINGSDATGSTNAGGALSIRAGNGGASSGNGGDLTFAGGTTNSGTAGYIAFQTGGSERLRVTPTGTFLFEKGTDTDVILSVTAASGADRTLTIPQLTADDTVALVTKAQTLASKTLTSPTITTSPTAAGATWTDLGTVTTADINGGTVDGAVIGGSSAAAGTFTALASATLNLGVSGTASITTQDTDEALDINPNGTGAVTFHGSTFSLTSAGVLGVADLTLGTSDSSATITTADTDENLTIDPNGTGTIFFHGGTYGITSAGVLTVASCSGCGGGTNFWIDGGTFAYLDSTYANDLVLGGTTEAAGAFRFDITDGGSPAYAELFIGTDSSKNGAITFYSSGAVSDPRIYTNATGDLNITAPASQVVLGNSSGNIELSLSGAQGDVLLAYKTFALTSAWTGNDYEFKRNLTANVGTEDMSGAVLHVTDTSDLGSVADSTGNLILGNVVVSNGTFTGNLIDLQIASTSQYKVDYTGLVSAGDLTLGMDDSSATISTADTETLTLDPASTGAINFHGSSFSLTSTGVLGIADLTLGTSDTSALITTADTEDLTIDPASTGTIFFHGATYGITSSGVLTVASCSGCAGAAAFGTSGGTITKTTAGDKLTLLYGDAADVQLLIENTTNSVVPTADAMQIDLSGGSGIATSGVDGLYINIEGTDISGGGTVAGIHINFDTVGAPSGDETLVGLDIDQLNSATSANESAIRIGNTWDNEIEFTGTTPQVKFANSSTFTITDGTNTIFTLADLSTNFGATVQAGSFVNYNSYFGLEFFAEATDVTADTAAAGSALWDEHDAAGNFQFSEQGTCTWATDNDDLLGVGSAAVGALDSACLAFYGDEGAATLRNMFDADNLPQMSAKARFSIASGTLTDADQYFFLGFGDYGALTQTEPYAPANGIFFSNCSDTNQTTCSDTLHGVVATSSTRSVTSSCGTISNTAYAYMEIRVITNANVQFWADMDVSNGINPTQCGSALTSNVPTSALGTLIGVFQDVANGAPTLELDYYRVWQDDAPSEGIVGQQSSQNSVMDPVSSSDIAEAYLSDNPEDLVSGTVLSIDPTEVAKVGKSTKAYDRNLMGIVTTSPYQVLGQETSNTVRVALSGRVPVNVSLENGEIKPGDYLTSSSIPGVAMKATKAGPVIGKALDSYEGNGRNLSDGSYDQILMFVESGDYNGEFVSIPDETDSAILNRLISQNGGLPEGVEGDFASQVYADRIAAQEVIAKKLVSQEVATRYLKNLEGEDIALLLSENGSFIVKDETGKDAIKFDSKGNATFAGVVTADKIRASQIEGLDGLVSSSSAVLSTQDKIASLTAELNSRFATASAVAYSSPSLSQEGSSTVSGSLRIRENGLIEGILTVLGNLTTHDFIANGLSTFFGDVLFKGKTEFASSPTFGSDTAGIAVIKKGENSVEVKFDKEYEDTPIIQATLQLEDMTKESLELYRRDGTCEKEDTEEECQNKITQEVFTNNSFLVTKKSKKGFTLLLKKDATIDRTFSWIAISVNKKEVSLSR